MKSIIFICFVSFLGIKSVGCFAQDGENKWSIGANFSPAFSSRIASSPNVLIDYLKYSPSYGLNGNIFVRKRLGKWGITGGFGYNLFQYVESLDPIDLTDPSGNHVLFYKVHSNFSFHYFSFPLRGEFYILDDNIRLYVLAGVEPSLNIAGRVRRHYEFPDGAVVPNFGYPINAFDDYTYDITYRNYYGSTSPNGRAIGLFNLNAVAGVGLGVPLGERFALEFEPYFRTQLLDMFVLDPNYSVRAYQIGVNFGVSYTIND